MKKALFFLPFLAISLASCGSGGDEPTSSTSAPVYDIPELSSFGYTETTKDDLLARVAQSKTNPNRYTINLTFKEVVNTSTTTGHISYEVEGCYLPKNHSWSIDTYNYQSLLDRYLNLYFDDFELLNNKLYKFGYQEANDGNYYAIIQYDTSSYQVYEFEQSGDLYYVYSSNTLDGEVESITFRRRSAYGAFSYSSRTVSGKVKYSIKDLDYGNLINSFVLPLKLGNEYIEGIDENVFKDFSSLSDVYVLGSKEEFDEFSVAVTGNDSFHDATKHFYSEVSPTEEGSYWHFVNNAVTDW